jgi:streptomycin 6-kinase
MDWSESLPSGLAWLERSERGRAWLRALPRLVEQCAQQWNLTLERPYAYAFTSLAVPAQLADGSGAVLKVQFRDRENEHEAAALRLWDGAGAIKLLAEDPARHALLLERCVPGAPLADAGEDVALQVLAGLLPRLWVPGRPPPFGSLHEESSDWGRIYAADGSMQVARSRRTWSMPRWTRWRGCQRLRVSRFCCTRTCTAPMSCRRSASRGWSSTPSL